MDKSIKEVKYIGFYDLPESEYRRVSTLAATNKMDYICDAINRAGFNVHLVSPSWYDDDAYNAKFKTQTTLQLNEQKRVTFCPSYGTKKRWFRNLKIIFTLLWLFFWLIMHVRRNEKIIVYHVQWLYLPIRWAKILIGFKLILEVEEIYGKVWKNKEILQIWEQKLLKLADYYIAVSEVLAEILGDKVKVIIYGNYSIPNIQIHSNNNGKINVVYAGSIDHTKGGAYNAIKCVRFLPDNYMLHICGFGKKASVNELEQQISKINKELSRETCKYHGIIPDEQFSDFLQSCQIALNPQYDGENMTTLFPSKIIKYLSHNLRVVSTRIKSIHESPFASLIVFSETDTPESIALAIMNIHFDEDYNSISLIRSLDVKFVNEIKVTLES